MAEYIKRETLINHLDACMDTIWKPEIVALKCFVEGIPAADVAPVQHGKWVPLVVKRENWKGVLHDFYQPYSCSICLAPNTFMGESAFCPHCGAKMIKEK